MLKRCIIAENRKLHASPIWVIFFVLPLISAGYGTFNYLQNRRMQPTFGGLSTLATTGT